MIQKHFYEAPEAELLDVRFEQRFMVESPDNPTSESYNPMAGNTGEDGWH